MASRSQAWKTKAQRDACVEQIFRLDLRMALEHYGIDFSKNRGKFALCPFHAEDTASFAVTERYWHCFGCNESGGLIKFVSKRFAISGTDAIEKICSDFGIGNIQRANPVKKIAELDISATKRRIEKAKQQAAEADYLDALTAFMDANDNLQRAYGIDPFSADLSDAYWRAIKARYALELADCERSVVYYRR